MYLFIFFDLCLKWGGTSIVGAGPAPYGPPIATGLDVPIVPDSCFHTAARQLTASVHFNEGRAAEGRRGEPSFYRPVPPFSLPPSSPVMSAVRTSSSPLVSATVITSIQVLHTVACSG